MIDEIKELERFDPLRAQIFDFVQPGLIAVVDSPSSALVAYDSARTIKFLEKAVEDLRKSLVGPINERVKALNARAKSVMEPLQKVETHLKTQLLIWERHLAGVRERERLLALAAQRVEREALAAALKAEEDKLKTHDFFGEPGEGQLKKLGDLDEAKLDMVLRQKRELTAIADNRVRGVSKVWTFELLRLAEVPREYLMLDTATVREAIAEGGREIPGIRIFQEERMSVR